MSDDISKQTNRLMVARVLFDPELKAFVIPWAESNYVGYAYHFVSGTQPDFLVYLVPEPGRYKYRIHVTKVDMEPEGAGTFKAKVLTSPDPDNDHLVSGFKLRPKDMPT